MTVDLRGARATAFREKVAELAGSGLEPLELLDEVGRRIQQLVPYDGGGWMTTDPDTVMPTGLVSYDAPEGLFAKLLEIEFGAPDLNKFADLARGEPAAATLRQATGGRMEISPRHNLVDIPHGVGDELRVVFRAGGSLWGGACLNRADDEPPFSAEETAFVASIADDLGRGLRAGLARPAAAADVERAPGMLILDERGQIESATGQARRWLAQIPVASSDPDLPTPVLAVAVQASLLGRPGASSLPARAHVRTREGAWLLVHAETLSGPHPRVGVMLEPAEATQLAPLLLRLHGLSGREREVAELLLAGISTEGIALQLGISRHTARDHFKAIFGKFGVASRPELMALLSR